MLKKTSILAIALMLAACNGQPPTVTAPPSSSQPKPSQPTRAIGTVVLPIDTSSVGPQTLNARVARPGADLAILRRESVAVNTDSSGKYISATFRVKNNSTSYTFSNLTLYAYSTLSRVAGTAISSVTQFGGLSDVFSAVTQTLPTHGTSKSGVSVVLDPKGEDFQAFTSAQAQAIQSDARTKNIIESTDTVLEYGYSVRMCPGNDCTNATPGPLAPGEEGLVTFGIKVPGTNDIYRFQLTLLVTDETTRQETRGVYPLEDLSAAQARATAASATLVQTDPVSLNPRISTLPAFLLEPQCGPTVAATTSNIMTVEGTGAASPLVGTAQTVEGVVTSVFPNLNGYFVQDRFGDGDLNTSDGIFVYSGAGVTPTVQVGDFGRVAGTVTELGTAPNTDTQLTSPTFTKCGTRALPSPVTVNFPLASSQADLEKYEGMQVMVPDKLTLTDHFQLGRFGQVVLASSGASNQAGTDDRLDQYTNTNLPSVSGNAAYTAEVAKRTLVLDDGSSLQNPPSILLGRGGNPLSASNTLRGGDTVSALSGVLDFRNGAFRIQPTAGVNFQPTNARPSSPARAPGTSLRVSSFNVLNFFNQLDTIAGSTSSSQPVGTGAPTFLPPAQNAAGAPCSAIEVRGAEQYSGVTTDASGRNEFARQRAKIVNAILSLDADVLGLTEIQNNGSGGSSAIVNLVATLNSVETNPTKKYAVVADPAQVEGAGCDAIKVAFIYRPSVVSAVGATDSSVTVTGDLATSSDVSAPGSQDGKTVTVSSGAAKTVPNGFDGNADGIKGYDGLSRKPMAVLFSENVPGGNSLTAVINHLKSKSSTGTARTGDSDQGDGQGQANLSRLEAARDLKAWLATNPLATTDSDVLLFGDFNAYSNEDPLRALQDNTAASGSTIAFSNLNPAESYSYVFNGLWGSLDHAFANDSLKAQVLSSFKYHINADEPSVLDYNLNFKSAAQLAGLYASDPFRSSDHDAVVVDLSLAAGPPSSCTVSSVSLAVSSVTLTPGGTSQLAPFVTSNPINCATVTWAANNGNVTVSSSGLVTAVNAGSSIVTVTATGTSGSTASSTANITVSAVAADFSLTLGAISPSSFVAGTAGTATLTLTLTLTPVGGYSGTPSYTVNNTGVPVPPGTPAEITGTVIGSGNVTTVNLVIPSSLAAGSYPVTVKGFDFTLGTRTSNTVNVTVTNPVVPTNIVFGAAFTAGDVVIYRVGDGTAALSGNATAAFLDEYTPQGTLVQSKVLPTADNGIHQTLTNSGSAASEGQLTRSSDGKCLVFAGYDAAPGTASVASASGIDRVVGVVFNGTPAVSNATLNTTTVIPDGYTGNTIRSATSDDCTRFWTSGTAAMGNTSGGVRYIALGNNSSTQVSTTVTNTRNVGIFGGQLYASSSSGAFRLTTVGAGTPTAAGQTITNLSGFPTSGTSSPYGFFFADLDAGVAGLDTVYVADDSSGAGIQKWSLNAGTWTLKNTAPLAGVRGLTGVVSGSSVTLYATTQTGFYSLTDSSGYNANINGTVSSALATPGTNTAFRGIALTPNP